MKVLKMSNVRLNTHMQHLESLIMFGKDGLNEINNYIENFLNRLEGAESKLNITQKLDGAPAVVCWSKFEGYPDNSICLKSFTTSNRNCLSSIEDIKTKYGDRQDMAEKLIYCLELAKYIPSNEAWQGDVMFTKNDLREDTINGVDYITFQPNKIVYAFSEENAGYNKIKNSEFGIAFHTIYRPAGEFPSKTQDFSVDLSRINVPNKFYLMSPVLNVSNSKEDYNIDVINSLFSKLKQIESKLISNKNYDDITSNAMFNTYWSQFENKALADNKRVTIDEDTFISDLKDFVDEKLSKERDSTLLKRSTEKGKQSVLNKYETSLAELNNIIDNNYEVLSNMVMALNLVAKIKMELLSTFNKAGNDYKTFLRHRVNGYEQTSGEGIAMSDSEGNIVKIVDRSEFSNANRDPNYLSGFQHESLNEDVCDFIGSFGDCDD